MHWFWAWRKLCSNINQISWKPLPSRAWTHGIPPCRSLKRPNLALLKSRIVILLIDLLPPQRILNYTISCSLQPRLPPTFTPPTSPSLFVSTRFSSTLLLIGSSTTCVRELSMHVKHELTQPDHHKAPYRNCYTLEIYLHTGMDHLNSQTGKKDTPEFEKARRNTVTAAKMWCMNTSYL